MSSLTYREPQKFPAAILALVVHAVFFSLLYFGVNWRVQPPETRVVEMWGSLPEAEPVLEVVPITPPPPPVEEAPVIEKAIPKVEPAPQVKADIELKDKKKKKELELKAKQEEKVKRAEKTKQEEKAKQLEVEKQRAEKLDLERQRLEKYSAQESAKLQQQQAKMRAEMDAAFQGEVARHTDLIRAKISRNIVMPPDVPVTAEAKFMVIVLPGGSVVEVKLLKSSGHAAYDSAAERAIYKAQPLPMPQDAALARVFRELRLSVKP
ncbi:MAG: cell envelope integrity protein TolA [Gallionellaceae bacterium]